jgi:hypothetical protein
VQQPPGVLFRFLDALGDFDFLLARQQRHLAHLLEVHAHRIVDDRAVARAAAPAFSAGAATSISAASRTISMPARAGALRASISSGWIFPPA